MKEYLTFTRDELRMKKKGDLAKMMGLEGVTYDTTLPQEWLDMQVKTSGINYNLFLSTTFWVYDEGSIYGRPVSGFDVVATYLEDTDNWQYIKNIIAEITITIGHLSEKDFLKDAIKSHIKTIINNKWVRGMDDKVLDMIISTFFENK